MINSRHRAFRPALLAVGLLLSLHGCSSSNETASLSDPIASDATVGDPSNDFDQAYQEAAHEDSNRAQDPLPEKDMAQDSSAAEIAPSAEPESTDPDLSAAPATDLPHAASETAADATEQSVAIAPADEVPDYTITNGQASGASMTQDPLLTQVQDEVKESEPAHAPVQEAAPTTDTESFESTPTVTESAAPAMDSSLSGDEAEYIVQPGDNLADIAKKLYGSRDRYKELAAANGISKPTRVHPGDVIKFKLDDHSRKFAEVYKGMHLKSITVKKGDTLSGIAKRTLGKAAFWKTIWKMNREVVQDPNKLEVGMTLKYYNPTKLSQALRAAGIEVAGSH